MKIHIPAFQAAAKCNEYMNHGPIDIDLGPDVVPVVRCRECKHWRDAYNDGLVYCMRPIAGYDYLGTRYQYPLEVDTRGNDFCSYGERREA